MERGQPPSLTVAEQIAAHEGVPPEELQPPLHYAVDTDALDSLVRSADDAGNGLSIEFAYGDYTVRVTDDGEVSILEPEPIDRSEREAV